MLRHLLSNTLAFTLAASAFAAEISGTFIDKGTAVVPALADSPNTVSLHALLDLEFAAELGASSHSGTRHVQIQHRRGGLEFKLLGLDQAVLTQWNWKTETYDATEGEGVMVRIQDRQNSDVSFFILLEMTANSELLQAKVIRHRATLFGPQFEAVGTYFFSKLR